ncbi:MAG: hypothetical protein ABR568_14665 [Pyrinomonadaceae bacterium]
MVGKQAKKKKVSGTKKSRALLQKQLAMPAGFYSDDSSVATLRDVVDPSVPTKQLSELTLEQRAELVAERLALQPSLNLAMIGAGVIDKQRAITEVKGKTRVGKLLIEIEHQMIRNLLEQAQKKAVPKAVRRGAKRGVRKD